MHANARHAGFTLVEVVATLVILGIVAMAGTLGLAEVMRSYVMTVDQSDMSQKAQVALNRLYVDLQHLTAVTSSSATAITFAPRFTFAQGVLAPVVVTYNDGTDELLVDGDVLLDNVSAFSLRYCSTSNIACTPTTSFNVNSTEVIEINITVGGADVNATGNRVQRTFQTRVQPVVFHFS